MNAFVILLLLIMLCQWCAWKFHLPAIFLFAICGLLIGPAFGFIDPESLLGDIWPVLVALSVAVILFDGGLTLNFHELGTARRGVFQLIGIGVPVGAALNIYAAHHIAGLSLDSSLVFGSVLIVTGPTVIIPMLRQAKLNQRVASLLKWEGIFNDPIGVILAVLIFEHYTGMAGEQQHYVASFLRLVILLSISWLAGRALIDSFRNALVPQYLQPPAVLTAVICMFVFGNEIQHEGGLLAVTIMGVLLANSLLPTLEDIRRFKETISLLLLAMIFILITATLSWDKLNLLGWRDVAFVLTVMFVTRPLTVLIATLGSGLSWKEKLFIGWIAPRGVVCTVISGFFGAQLVGRGIEDGARLVPLAFAVVFATVIAHGFSVKYLSERLGLASAKKAGLLIVGGPRWAVELAKLMRDRGVHVTIFDANWRRLRMARQADVPSRYINLLTKSLHAIEMHEFTHVMAVSEDFAYNSLVCAKLGGEFERSQLFQLPGGSEDEKNPHVILPHLMGRPFLGKLDAEAIERRWEEGWRFRAVKLTEAFTYANYEQKHEAVVPVLTIEPNGRFSVITDAKNFDRADVTLISFVSKLSETETKDMAAPPVAGEPAAG